MRAAIATTGKWARLLGSSAVLILLGCAGSRGGKVPLGVSAEVAARADAITAKLFVSPDQERQAEIFGEQGIKHYLSADSIWAALDTMRRQAEAKKAAADSTDGLQAASATASKPPGDGLSRPNLDPLLDRKLTIQGSYRLIEAEKSLEKSLQLYPFDPQTRNYLALTLRLFAEQFPKERSYDKPLEIWKDLAQLEPGEYLHFYNLGATAFAAKKWREALVNYGKAEELMLASAEVSQKRVQNPSLPKEAAVDSARWLSAVYRQALSAIKLEEVEPALRYLCRARTLTDDSTMVDKIDYYLKWINWDAGNIRGAILRDSAAELASEWKYVEAVKIYDDLINKTLKTKRARDDISWDYASIEYNRLNRKARAIVRLDEVIKTLPTDTSGVPLDSSYKDAFENYGRMCHNLGVDTIRVDRRVAYGYFERATTVSWSGRGKSYAFMAELTQSNADLAIRNGEYALKFVNQLTAEQLKKVYKILIDGYRRKRQMDTAREYFAKLRAIR